MQPTPLPTSSVFRLSWGAVTSDILVSSLEGRFELALFERPTAMTSQAVVHLPWSIERAGIDPPRDQCGHGGVISGLNTVEYVLWRKPPIGISVRCVLELDEVNLAPRTQEETAAICGAEAQRLRSRQPLTP